ncbi:bacteriohopanetetrol glucosamine biosynthesis glycosyltransferase HpnI [Rhodopila sp.]|jgi:ceramide glucosyltransferase|uniref:bacteriohopanetetrol glucosamine biosynthesis glycosyltransferase HpnI n=1 Tax=Rhodopila sp. TaxID=2480087 RepID=UPI002C4DEDE8|nr:bacteriohopanetetrol glucosamine biosynthesis glycosyltransferase HpnI [Rhodopila sp.]HVZ09387.1 bacteriohopanetetrol glucosamine biosynthesis glycosyltransferase HpnI [Rhodopila sp.]
MSGDPFSGDAVTISVVVAIAASVLAALGLVQSIIGWWLADRFLAAPRTEPPAQPPMTILKPLYGDEPLLAEALASVCRQAYPAVQVLFGVGSETDAAVPVAQALRRQFPHVDIDVVVDPTLHGPNRKVGNLINMLPYAKHDVLVIADSDVHAAPDLLNRLAEALARPRAGLATVLYAGLPAFPAMPCRFGAMQITHTFLPGALLARRMGRQDCLGATMALRRAELDRIGGLQGLVAHLADDAVLGRKIRALGLDVVLADTLVLTTVPETTWGALFRHELRWARTIRALEAAGFGASILQFSLFWALFPLLLTGFTLWSIAVFGVAWAVRMMIAVALDGGIERRLRREGEAGGPALTYAVASPVWLLPLRDLLSVVVLLGSFVSRKVDWRGHDLIADTPPPSVRLDKT